VVRAVGRIGNPGAYGLFQAALGATMTGLYATAKNPSSYGHEPGKWQPA
jgi:hypothetical protein